MDYFFPNQSQKHPKGCRWNADCSCGQDCKCGPGCRCGKPSTQVNPPKDKYMYHKIQGVDLDPKQKGHKCQKRSQFPTGFDQMHPKHGLDSDQRRPGNRMNQRQQPCHVDDDVCRQCENVFKKFDPKATIFPGVGLPSQNNGVCTIMHGMGPGAKNLKIQGLESKSPLANAALFSTECSSGHFLNLYEMMLPEAISAQPGRPSGAQQYAADLNNMGLSVAGNHWHWWGSDPYSPAIHHQNVDMHPVEFAEKTVQALSNYKNNM